MICSRCGKEGIEPGDAFCRHCGFSVATQTSTPEGAAVAEKKRFMVRNRDASKGLELFGVAIFAVVSILVLVVASSIGWPTFGGSVLPWLAGAVMLVGLAMIFIGLELHHAR
jgi:ribosomal protein L37E